MEDHVVVCGSDGLAARVLEELHALGEDLVLVTPHQRGRAVQSARTLGIPVIDTDTQDDRWLDAADVAHAEAVAVLETDDVGNLEAALAVEEANPEVRLVLRFFNAELGERLEQLFVDCETLSASSIAAPAFVYAALHGNTAMPVRIKDRRLVVRENPEAGGKLQVAASTEHVPPAAAEGPPVSQAAHKRWLLLRATLSLLDRRVAFVGLLLAVLVGIATVVFHLTAGFEWIDSVYFTLTTVTTTGYGDLNLLEEPALVKLAGNALMVLGATLIAILFAFLTDALVSAQVARQLGNLPIPEEGHAVVCGLGNVGVKVVRELRAAGIPCAALDRNEHNPFVDAIRREGVPVLVADAGDRDALARLNVHSARVVLAITDSDLANLETALNVRARRDDMRVVVRLFSAPLAGRIEDKFDIAISRSLSALAAPAFVAAIVRRRWLATVPLGTRALAVAEIGAPSTGTIRELEASTELLVLEAAGEWDPRPEQRLDAGEPLLVLASRDGLARADPHT